LLSDALTEKQIEEIFFRLIRAEDHILVLERQIVEILEKLDQKRTTAILYKLNCPFCSYTVTGADKPFIEGLLRTHIKLQLHV